RP
ncbi:histidine kinase-, DNA gyrase B-, and HSP90-like ATPase family protein, partial [Vibrio parahaemolyticus AQ3810]